MDAGDFDDDDDDTLDRGCDGLRDGDGGGFLLSDESQDSYTQRQSLSDGSHGN